MAFRRRRRRIGGRRRRRGGRAPRRLKRYVHNAITSRLPPKQRFALLTANMSVGTLYHYTIGSGITKGTDRGDRIGDSIDMKGLKMRFDLRNTATTMLDYPTVRIMLLRTREPHTSEIENMFKGEGQREFQPEDFANGGDFDQIYKPLNRRKFSVVMDKKIKLMPAVAECRGKHQKNFTVYIPMKSRLKYNPEADAGNWDYIKPNYVLLYFVEKNNSATGLAILDFVCRLTEFYRG